MRLQRLERQDEQIPTEIRIQLQPTKVCRPWSVPVHSFTPLFHVISTNLVYTYIYRDSRSKLWMPRAAIQTLVKSIINHYMEAKTVGFRKNKVNFLDWILTLFSFSYMFNNN